MQKLFESFRKYVLKETYEYENIKALSEIPVEGYYRMEFFTSKFPIDLNDASHMNILAKTKILQNNKIVKGVGAGKYGIAYQLDNDHILKFFVASHNPSFPSQPSSGIEDIKKYKSIQDRQFQGISHRGEPAIYDVGEIKFPPRRPHDIFTIYYVELGKVIPFTNWVEMTDQNLGNWNQVLWHINNFSWAEKNEIKGQNSRVFLKKFLKYLKDYYHIKDKDYYEKKTDVLPKTFKPSNPNTWARQHIKSKSNPQDPNKIPVSDLYLQEDVLGEIPILNSISKKALVGLIKGLSNYINKTGEITDFHAGNFGVIPSNNQKEPDIFVFFDI